MDLKSFFKKNPVHSPETDRESSSESSGRELTAGKSGAHPEIPDGLLIKCQKCCRGILRETLERNLRICPKCGGYLKMPARQRIAMLLSEGSFHEWDAGLENHNPLHLKGYGERVRHLQETLQIDEAVLTGCGTIRGEKEHRIAVMVMDSFFLTASMGEVVGEKITRGIERAVRERLPVLLVCCSGGARMQEGMISLMQMAKTAAALRRHHEAGLFSITVLTDPTMGGVTASFAMLGDIILAEAGALIGFAGPRVIEQTIRQKLPKGFQRAEFLLEHGFVDAVVQRGSMRETIGKLLDLHTPSDGLPQEETVSFTAADASAKGIDRTAWERVCLARAAERPEAGEYLRELFDDFLELHGDRAFGDDPAVTGGIASFCGVPVTVIAQRKGKDTKENLRRNFGMPKPEGYRKALRLMRQAEKFHRPILCFVDTPGAFCGMEAEERGQGEAIARNLFEMSGLKTPILTVFIGEGGSGGALALAVSDEVWMLENSIYSILSPEGFAAILWKDASLSERAARVMGLTSYDLLRMGVIEKIIAEPEHFCADTLSAVTEPLKAEIRNFLIRQRRSDPEQLLSRRYDRFRKF